MTMPRRPHFLAVFLFLLPFSSPSPLLPSDAVALLTFKSHADLDRRLLFAAHLPFDFCHWPGVSCTPAGRVLRLLLPSFSLRGSFPPNSLSGLDQLRVLNLRNNSIAGPLPADLHRLVNLKTLLLDRNLFSGDLPPSLFSLYKLRVLDLAFNNFSGPIPVAVNRLDRLLSLRLEFNRLIGSIPPLNQTSLEVFNVSGNNLTGEVPKTPTLSRFHASSFSDNPNLCGGVLNTPCNGHGAPFFNASSAPSNSPSEISNSDPAVSDSATASPPQASSSHKRKVFALGLSLGTVFLLASLFCFVAAMRSNRRRGKVEEKPPPLPPVASGGSENSPLSERMSVGFEGRASNELISVKESKREREMKAVAKSGKLVFAVGETPAFTMEQLMRASAEMLGRGNVGTTYKAKLDNHLVVTVKRLDATRTAGVSEAALDRHMELVGALRHPNLVPVRAYFQAKEERLIIYDYQPNGSVYNLVHGSRSTRTKPLHWTSCLKIAEDVAQSLAYIHQASKLIHGNLKATNVLLGPDFEACITDYCLHVLKDPDLDNLDPDTARYKAPEIRNPSGHRPPTIKSDVYAFGVLLVELLSGKAPSEHPFIAPPDLPGWVRTMRDQDGGEEEDERLEMLVDVAGVCSLVSPEQRPTMTHVLRMIQRIKNSVVESG